VESKRTVTCAVQNAMKEYDCGKLRQVGSWLRLTNREGKKENGWESTPSMAKLEGEPWHKYFIPKL